MRPSHESRHRPPRGLAPALAGGLLFAAALALSLPGVRAVHADEARPASPVQPAAAGPAIVADAPMCRAKEAPNAAGVAARLQALRAQARRAAANSGAEVVNLNTRGYNYRSDTLDAQILAVFREATLRERARR